MKTELKPCQCGCDTVEIIHIPGKRQMILTCPKCRIIINHKYIRMNPDELRKAIVKAWNTRPIEDILQARITELEGKLESACHSDAHFRNVTKLLQSRITELEKSQVVWHKYPDEKPESGKECLVLFDDGDYILDIYNSNLTWMGILSEYLYRITHWAYLPEPPKGEK